ncbi:hypothetical protein GCK32_003620 [Trichostrongylus colubriformis]|uniref:Uncharacterized protein n=1 Tax=Trichostrongylus colubriformis TaxID=6319 RepID=A0AAN8G729_TRICO
MEHSLQSDPSHIKPLQNYLIELTSVIEKAKSTVSNDHISIAMGILFKHSATLLDIQNGTDTAISVMLHSLAYQHLSSVSPKNAEVSAWIALHLLETAAAITNTELPQKEVAISLNRDDLAEYCVDCLISAEGGIQRLHAGVYREGIRNFPIILPNITAKHIEPLLNRLIPFLHRPEVLRMIVWMIGHNNVFRKMTIFDNVLSKSSIGRNVDFVGSNLTSTDVKVCFCFRAITFHM